jgi:hypothetical protein
MTRTRTAIEDAELRVEQPVEVRLVGHPEDVAVVSEALARMVPTAGLTPLRERRAPDSRHTGNTTVVTGAGPSMTREHSTGEPIDRPSYAAFVEQIADSSAGRRVEVDGVQLHRAAELLGQLANLYGQHDPVGRLAAGTASRLWSALGI